MRNTVGYDKFSSFCGGQTKYRKTRREEKRKRLLFSAVNIKNKKIFVEDIYPEDPNTTPIINRSP